eukprot:COSAG06_NODE_3114_length_5840_cov_26.926842_9_plen_85_part_01
MRLRAARALLLPVLDAPTKSGAPTVFGDGLGPACLEGTALANSAQGPTPPPVAPRGQKALSAIQPCMGRKRVCAIELAAAPRACR